MRSVVGMTAKTDEQGNRHAKLVSSNHKQLNQALEVSKAKLFVLFLKGLDFNPLDDSYI